MIIHSVEGEVAWLESYPDRCLQGLTKTTNDLKIDNIPVEINLLNPELNPICYLLALLAHHILHVGRIRVKSGNLLNKRFLPMLWIKTLSPLPGLILMDLCIVDYSVEIPTRCSFVIEFIIPKFFEGSTCYERHTAHHQEL